MIDTSIIEVLLEPTNVITRWPCALCGGHTEKAEVIALFDYEGEEWEVCEGCLADGSAGARRNLLSHAEYLERKALDLRSLAERTWRMPTPNECRGAYIDNVRRRYGDKAAEEEAAEMAAAEEEWAEMAAAEEHAALGSDREGR